MMFKVGDKVHYRVYPSGEPNTAIAGEVVRIEKLDPAAATRQARYRYFVYWDDIDRQAYPPSEYAARDLAPADDDARCDRCEWVGPADLLRTHRRIWHGISRAPAPKR